MNNLKKLFILIIACTMVMPSHALLLPYIINYLKTSESGSRFNMRTRPVFSSSSLRLNSIYYRKYHNGFLSYKMTPPNTTVIPVNYGLLGRWRRSYNLQRYRNYPNYTVEKKEQGDLLIEKQTSRLTPAEQAYQRAQDLMEECMLNTSEEKPFSYYIDEVVKIANEYPDEMCTQLNIDDVDELIYKLDAVKNTHDCTEVISTLRPYWCLLPPAVQNTYKFKLIWNLGRRLGY